jgi:hypothetical protein
MNSEILKKNWEPEEIRKSQLNDNKLNSYTTVKSVHIHHSTEILSLFHTAYAMVWL